MLVFVGSSCPERVIVELDTLVLGIAENHCAEAPVADGQCFVPFPGGLGIPQLQVVPFPVLGRLPGGFSRQAHATSRACGQQAKSYHTTGRDYQCRNSQSPAVVFEIFFSVRVSCFPSSTPIVQRPWLSHLAVLFQIARRFVRLLAFFEVIFHYSGCVPHVPEKGAQLHPG